MGGGGGAFRMSKINITKRCRRSHFLQCRSLQLVERRDDFFSSNFAYHFQAAENGLILGELDLTSQDFMLDEVDGRLRCFAVYFVKD